MTCKDPEASLFRAPLEWGAGVEMGNLTQRDTSAELQLAGSQDHIQTVSPNVLLLLPP